MSPAIALLIPCYNATGYLPRLRASIDALTTPFSRVLLADDKSTDDTLKIAQDLGFEIIPLAANVGPGGARNALVDHTTEEWIHFHDVDDPLHADYVAQVSPLLNTQLDVLLHATDFVSDQDQTLMKRWTVEADALRNNAAAELLRHPLPAMSSCLRRRAFLQIGGFHPTRRCFEDGDLHFRIGLAELRIKAINDVLSTSLRNDSGVSADQHYCCKCRLAFLEDYRETTSPALHRLIALEAERVAVHLLRHGDRPTALQAIALCEQLGHVVPSSGNPLLRLARYFLPADRLLRWQDRIRFGKT